MISSGLDDGGYKNIISVYGLTSFIKQMTFFKNPKNANRINLILTNKSFQCTCVILGFHRMTFLIPKFNFPKLLSKVTKCRNLGSLIMEKLLIPLKSAVKIICLMNKLKKPGIYLLNHHAPLKKYFQGIIAYIMQKTCCGNKFLKKTFNENKLIYTRQRNIYLAFLKKEKNEYFVIVYENDISFCICYYYILHKFSFYVISV